MKILYSEKDFNKANGSAYLPLKCYSCEKSFMRQKKEIVYELKHQRALLIS